MQADLAENLGNETSPNAAAAIDFTPVWAPATFTYKDKEWYKVGIRYKGNSSLETAYNNETETDTYTFKLDFNEFENEFPSIDTQRFYKFKQLNLGNNIFMKA